MSTAMKATPWNRGLQALLGVEREEQVWRHMVYRGHMQKLNAQGKGTLPEGYL
jgi:hypothetical protein